MTSPFRLEELGPAHDRTEFACGEPALDRYFLTQVGQDVQRRIANCFVAVDEAVTRVAGFYTIAATSLPINALPPEDTRRLPRYPLIPAALIGRLAVDQNYQGRRLGEALLADAARRMMQAPPAVFALVVDAKSDPAADFYRRYGFRSLASRPLTLFLPMKTAEKTLL